MPGLADYLAFRRAQPPRPELTPVPVRARGIDFSVWCTPPVPSRPPLVCINGGLIFDHSLVWPALSPLAHDRQLFVYDQRGRGASSVPPGWRGSRIEYDAADLRAIREALGIPQWDVLGHSWGGGIAMLAAHGDVEAVRRLVLVNAVGVTSRWIRGLHEAGLARLPRRERERLAAFHPEALHEPDVTVHAAYAQAYFPAWFADWAFAGALTPPQGSSQTGAAVVARLRREGYDWSSALRGLPIPTLVVHGTEDPLPMAEAKRTMATLGRARLCPMPGAGHNPFLETPAPFFAAVRTFLDEPEDPNGGA